MASRECIAIFNAYAFDASVMLLAQVMGSSVAMVAAGELSPHREIPLYLSPAPLPCHRIDYCRFDSTSCP